MAHDVRDLVAKADLALADLTADGGILQQAQAAKFLSLAIKQSQVMPLSTIVTMRSFKQLIEKISFNGRVLRAGAVSTALAAADRVKPDTSKVELDAKLFKGEVRLSNEILEDSIERGRLRSTIMSELLKAVPRDIDEVIINGDTASADTFLAQFDGLLKAAASNLIDANDAGLSRSLLKSVFRSIAPEFRRDKGRMRFLTGSNAEVDYRDTLADRQGPLGDAHAQEDRPARYQGVPITGVDMFLENLGAGTDQTNVLLTDMRNVNIGFWRQVTVETDKDISAGVVIIVVSMRFDTKYTHEPAVAKINEVKVAA